MCLVLRSVGEGEIILPIGPCLLEVTFDPDINLGYEVLPVLLPTHICELMNEVLTFLPAVDRSGQALR